MGCSSSKPPAGSGLAEVGRKFSNRSTGPLTDKEIQARIEAPKQSQVMKIGDVTYRYAWVSQRGYYPDAPDKDNQDEFCIFPKFGTGDQAFFGVFDGHGKEGHYCARYVRDNLPKSILAKLEKQSSPLTEKAVRQALTTAHFTTNDNLHADASIDDTLSGTTSISILFRGKTMFVSNVGDSRAIIGSMQPDKRVVAKPMSSDQTPYRKDERERVKKHGARILSMDQIEGLEPIHENWGEVNLGEDIDEGGDPPRVWSPHGDYPGTAFTRSFGDMYAEELGVSAEAEIFVRDISTNDKYVIIASDGVFEFLTNQMVIDMAAQTNDPLEACNAIVSAAYNMWLQYEVRTDDITIVALYVESNVPEIMIDTKVPPIELERGSFSVKLQADRDERPVRRAVSREKRKTIIMAQDEEKLETDALDFNEILVKVSKSDDERLAIEEAIRSNFLFQHINHAQRQLVVDVMQPVNVTKGDWVIRQGDKGDRFYVIDSGTFEVRVNPPGKEDQTGGPVVHVYTSGPGQHPGFGELSLMYGKPRAASVIAVSDGRLWALDRRVFRTVVMRSVDARKGIIRTLKKVELLKCLNNVQMQRLVDLLVEDVYPENHYIIRQGEVGDNFYLIVKGSCDCTINSSTPSEASETLVMQLKDNDYFGEKALLTANPRAANVIARSLTKVLYINKKAFEEVLGPLSEIIDRDRERRESMSRIDGNMRIPKQLSDIIINGVVSQEPSSLILSGSFGNPSSRQPNITVRSFLLNEVDRLGISSAVIANIDVARIVSAATSTSSNHVLPRLLTVIRDSNAIHLVIESAITCDLATIVLSANARAGFPDSTTTESPTLQSPQQPLRHEVVAYIAGSIIAGLEQLHSLGIAYRAIQPESIAVDIRGFVQLTDYRVSKAGLRGENKTFTICGATDYLAPEQISQRGHSTPVDLWALGTLMYELSVGTNPFGSNSEVATYTKISTFGSKSFPSLLFPEYVSSEIKAIINQLLVPTPEARLGASVGGFESLKKHALFRGFDWKASENMRSPLQALAAAEQEEVCRDGIDPKVFDAFAATYDADNSSWIDSIDVDK